MPESALRLGWGNMPEASSHLAVAAPGGKCRQGCAEAFPRKGHDHQGHWEIAGLLRTDAVQDSIKRLSPGIYGRLSKASACECLGNYPASGTEIIEVLGDEA